MARQIAKRTSPIRPEGTIKLDPMPKTVTKTRTMSMPSEEQIRARAFEIFQRRNGGPGDACSDWLQAEHELRMESSR